MILLGDEILLLREFRLDDANAIVKIANNINIAQNLRDGFPHPYGLADAHKFIDIALSQRPPSFFAIEYKGSYVGNISLSKEEDVYRQSAEIGYFIGEDDWGKGIATRAVQLITDYGFKQLNLIRIHTGIYEYNVASMRVLEKCGFKKEGIFEKAITKFDQLYDEHRYALIHRRI